MPEEEKLIKEEDYIPELETEVSEYMKNLEPIKLSTKLHPRVETPHFDEEADRKMWELGEIDKCINGDGDMCGKMYFYFNYCWIREQRGKIRPQFRMADNEWFETVEFAQKSQKYGVICVKRRRAGFSWKAASDVLHDASFNSFFNVGMNSMSEKDSVELFRKVKFIYNLLPQFLRATSTAHNTKMGMHFSYKVKDKLGNPLIKGTQSELIVVAPTDSAYEGLMLQKWICDEAGKINNLNAMWSYTEPCLMQETKRMGTPIIFGCVTKGTKLWDSKGSLVNVEDIKTNDGIVGYNGVSASVGRVLYVNPPQKKECVRIKTNKGKILECSIDHPILRQHKQKYWHSGSRKTKKIKDERVEFINANGIKIGDRVGVIEEVSIFGNKKMFSPRLIGLLIGDGSYGFDNTPKLSNAEIEINNYIEKEFNTSLDRSYITKDGRLYKETRIKEICPIMRDLGIYGQTKLRKTLPLNIHSYRRDDICELIGGFFDADGYVANMKNNKNISISSASRNLLLELSMLLQKLGIHGGTYRIKKSEKNPRDKNDHFRLTISDKRSVLAFYKNIRFLTKRKQNNLNEIVARFSNHKSEIGKYSIGKRYERVVSVEYIGERDVYNFGTNSTGTYIANGIITHNTAGEISREGRDLKKMWDNAKAYNLIRFFFKGYMGMDVDKYGNDQPEEIIRWIVYERYRKRDLDPRELNDFVQQYPLTTAEAFSLANTGGLGNIVNINRQVTNLRESPVIKANGSFTRNSEGKVLWVPSVTGKCIVYEHPKKDLEDYAVSGIDPADHDNVLDEASDMSMYIMSKQYGQQPPKILFEYTDRPQRANDYYEQAAMALEYYNNTKVLIENNRYRMIGYFEDFGHKHLLRTQPMGIKQLTPTRQNIIGVRMSADMKEYLEGLVEEYVEDHCDMIPGVALLEEFIEYGSVNTDRVMAFGVTLIAIKDDKLLAKRRDRVKRNLPSARLRNINGVLTRGVPESYDKKGYFRQ